MALNFNSSGNDFVEAEPAEISGRVFGDLDRNGVEGAFEPGVDGITVNLIQDESVIGSVSTDSDGVYQFTGLTPGVLAVSKIEPPDIYIFLNYIPIIISSVPIDIHVVKSSTVRSRNCSE